MATLTVEDCLQSGLTPTFVAADVAGDQFFDDGEERTVIEVVNGSGSSITVSVARVTTTLKTREAGALNIPNNPASVSVAAGTRKIFGPFPRAYLSTANLVSVSYSAVTSVTVNARRVKPAYP